MSKPTVREQLDAMTAENEAILHENAQLKQLVGAVLEDTRINEHVRREYTKAYIAVMDEGESEV